MSTPKLSSHHFAAVRTSLVRYATTGRRETSSTQLAADLCRALNVSPFGSDNTAPKSASDALVFDLQRLNALAFSKMASCRASSGCSYQKGVAMAEMRREPVCANLWQFLIDLSMPSQMRLLVVFLNMRALGGPSKFNRGALQIFSGPRGEADQVDRGATHIWESSLIRKPLTRRSSTS